MEREVEVLDLFDDNDKKVTDKKKTNEDSLSDSHSEPSLKDDVKDNSDKDVKESLDKVNSSDDSKVPLDENVNSSDEEPSGGKKKKPKKKMKLWKKIVISIVILIIIGASSLAFLLYGPYNKFRNWLITSAMTTMSHQYLATWFYDEDTINNVLSDNYVEESGESTDSDQINFGDYSSGSAMFLNKYEKELLTREEGTIYKKIDITGDGQRGYLIAIYDPSKVKVAAASTMGTSGQMLTTIAKSNNALVAMNASGFMDPNYRGNGGHPLGAVIIDGKLVSHSDMAPVGGGVIGFTKDNKLVLGSGWTGEQAINNGIRDGVAFGPFLIVNGKAAFIKGNGGWGTAPRSAIAQRKDGIVLFLVMDGRDYVNGIAGPDMVDLTEILLKYGAYNAANLDGGTSSGLVINNQFVNKPVNGSGKKKTRAIPNAWIVTK